MSLQCLATSTAEIADELTEITDVAYEQIHAQPGDQPGREACFLAHRLAWLLLHGEPAPPYHGKD
jgi:hypothetical protein